MARNNFASLWKGKKPLIELEEIFGEEFHIEEENKKDYYRDFVFLEFLFYSHTKVFNVENFKMNNPIAMFYGHEELIYNGIDYDKKLLNKTIFLTKGLYHKKELERIIELYFSISEKFRLFKKEEDEVSFNYPKYCSWRKEIFDSILFDKNTTNSISKEKLFIKEKHKEKKITIFKKYKSKKEEEQEKIDFSKLPFVKEVFDGNSLGKKHEFHLEKLIEKRKKEKKGISDLNRFLPDSNTYEEMGGSYPKRFNDLEVYEVSNRNPFSSTTNFFYHEINHILASTGAGKTTLTHGLIFSAIHKGNKKIMIFTNNTQETIQEKNKLEALNFTVGAVIGDSNLEEHQSNFVKNKAPELESPYELLEKHYDDLETMNKKCLIRPYFDMKEDERNPCKSLKIYGEKKAHVCPMYDLCSAHYRYRKLLKSDIWIGTPEAFVKSVAPYQWDSKERSILELGILWADMIIIDEVDNIQKRLDNLFIDDMGIVADDKEQIDTSKYFADYLFEIIPKVVKSKTEDSLVGEYVNRVNELQSAYHYIYGQILSEYHMVKYLRNKPFTSYRLLREWFKSFCKVEDVFVDADPNFIKFYNDLTEFYDSSKKEEKEPILQMELLYLHQKLKNVSLQIIDKEKSIEQRDICIDNFLRQFEDKTEFVLKEFDEIANTGKIKEEEEKRRKRNRRFEFILFLLKTESLIHYLRTRYDNFINRAELKDSLTFSKDYIYKTNVHHLYTPSPLTDTFSVYRLVENKTSKGKHYSFESNEYKGIGRNLMVKFNRIFEGIEDHPIPSMLFLSATSDVPHSSHFGVNVEPNWLLENKNQKEQKIKITACAVFDGEEGYYKLSGEKNQEEAFQNITSALIRSNVFKNIHEDHKQLLIEEREEAKIRFKLEEDLEEKKILEKEWNIICNESIPVVGIIVKSFQKAEWIAKMFIKNGIKPDEFKVLYTSKPVYNGKSIDRSSYHITINEVENLYNFKIKYFILVRESLQRSYNILASKDSKRSLLRTLCYYERPHPVPGQFEDAVMTINAKQSLYFEKIKKKGLNHYEAEKFLNQQSHIDLQDIFVSSKGYSGMDENGQKNIAANELVTTLQMSGRAMRGGTSFHIMTFDVKMAPKTFGTNSLVFIDEPINADQIDGEKIFEDSMLARWKEILVDSKDELTQRVHKPWIKALQNIEVKYIKGDKDND